MEDLESLVAVLAVQLVRLIDIGSQIYFLMYDELPVRGKQRMTYPLAQQPREPQDGLPTQSTPPDDSPTADAWLDAQLKQYQMYVETAERNSDRRTAANRLYVTVHTTLMTLLAIVGGYGLVISLGGSAPAGAKSDLLIIAQTPLVVVASLLGVALGIVWNAHIRSFRELSAAKFKVINDIMEPKLPFQPFKDEWAALQKQSRSHLQFNTVERVIIWLTAALYVAWLVIYLVVTIHPQWLQFPLT